MNVLFVAGNGAEMTSLDLGWLYEEDMIGNRRDPCSWRRNETMNRRSRVGTMCVPMSYAIQFSLFDMSPTPRCRTIMDIAAVEEVKTNTR
jgi:hypothetical protein